MITYVAHVHGGAPPAPSAAKSSCFLEMELLARGTVVCLTALSSQPMLNGCHGHVLRYEEERQRYGVKIVGGKTLALRPASLIHGSGLDVTTLSRDAVAAHEAEDHALATSLLRELLFSQMRKKSGSDQDAGEVATLHLKLATSLVALRKYAKAVEAADVSIRLDSSLLPAHLQKAIALEGLGKKRESCDALIVGARASGGSDLRPPSLLAPMLSRLTAEGERDGWIQGSEASVREAKHRQNVPHCATCLEATPWGYARPPPEASCQLCGMVQYCCAEHKEADKLHRAFCGPLRDVAMRTMWRRSPAYPVTVDITPDGAAMIVQCVENGSAAPVRSLRFPQLSSAEVMGMRGWADLFRASAVQCEWLESRGVPDDDRGGGRLFGPTPPPMPSPEGARPPSSSSDVVMEHISQETRTALGEELTDALTTIFALREVGRLSKLVEWCSLNGRADGAVCGALERIERSVQPPVAGDDTARLNSSSEGDDSDSDDTIQLEMNDDGGVGDESQSPLMPELEMNGNDDDGDDDDGPSLEENDASTGAAECTAGGQSVAKEGLDSDEEDGPFLEENPHAEGSDHGDDDDVDDDGPLLEENPLQLAEGTPAEPEAEAAPRTLRVHFLGSEEPIEGRRLQLLHAAVERAVLACADLQGARVRLETMHVGPGMRTATYGDAAAFRGSYGDYHRSPGFRAPHLLVAFHPGVYTNSHGYTWMETIEIALEMGVPFAMTAFTSEDARCTRELLEAAQVRVVLDRSNPFASPRTEQRYPCENLLAVRNRHLFAFHGAAEQRGSPSDVTRSVAQAGAQIKARLLANPLNH